MSAARDNERKLAHDHLDTAAKVAGQLGEDRDDYGTEFGPTNVAIHAVSIAIHAVSIAVQLGDAGQAALGEPAPDRWGGLGGRTLITTWWTGLAA